MERMGAS